MRRVYLVYLPFSCGSEVLLSLHMLPLETIHQLCLTIVVCTIELRNCMILISKACSQPLLLDLFPLHYAFFFEFLQECFFVLNNFFDKPIHYLPIVISFFDIAEIALAHLPFVKLLQQFYQKLYLFLLIHLLTVTALIP